MSLFKKYFKYYLGAVVVIAIIASIAGRGNETATADENADGNDNEKGPQPEYIGDLKSELENSNLLDLYYSRSTVISPKEIAGMYKGESFPDKNFPNNIGAMIINLYDDGTYYIESYALGKLMDTFEGNYELSVEKDEKQDSYGKTTKTTYSHSIKFIHDTEYGQRDAVYSIGNSTKDGYIVLSPKRQWFSAYQSIYLRIESKLPMKR